MKIIKINENTIPKDRLGVILKLAQYTHPSIYHHILTWKTDMLQDYLRYRMAPKYTRRGIDGVRKHSTTGSKYEIVLCATSLA